MLDRGSMRGSMRVNGADGAVRLGNSTLMNIIGVWIGPRRATICSAVVRSGDRMTDELSRIRKSRIGSCSRTSIFCRD